MRAISLVDRLEFNFSGNVVRKGIALGDVDNDGQNELVIGADNGEVVIFKERSRLQTIKELGFVSCIAIGDILNINKNCLIVITADGWCHIYYCTMENYNCSESSDVPTDEGVDQVDGQVLSGESIESEKSLSSEPGVSSSHEKNPFKCIHTQRIPANSKDILLADIDGDGLIEMVLGLTDRVVRSYRWYNSPQVINSSLHVSESSQSYEFIDKVSGKLVGLNKWECANQIGSVTLHHLKDGCPSLLVAQPGGTFMRIKCQSEEAITRSTERTADISDSGSSRSESLTGSTIDYQFLGISRMRNPNISTEILGNLITSQDDDCCAFKESADKCSIRTRSSSNSSRSEASGQDSTKDTKVMAKGKPYAVATLDGTIMLVQDEIILWAIAVDHQIFALTKLDVTGNGLDDIVACTWDGHTYILDQHKNTVRFQLDESVQAFDSGHYNINCDSEPVTCLVYVTFHNKIYLYYDIPLKEMICRKFEPNLSMLGEVFLDEVVPDSLDQKTKKQLVEYLLYGVD